MQHSLLESPLLHQSCPDYPIIQYADDTILVAKADARQLNHIKDLLLHYAAHTGLKVNYTKSIMISINTPLTKMTMMSRLLGCKIGSLPHTYLGLPLCISKPKIEDFVPMMKRIENSLLSCSTMLSTGDKLTLIKFIFTSMPTFFMCSLMLPKTVVKQINIYLKQCFWRKYGTQETGAALISWEKVCRPKAQGGLGILDIATHNQALLMKYLHKFMNKEDTPWVNIIWETYYQESLPGERMVGSFWWKTVLKLLPMYKTHARCKANKGDTTLFWTDNWTGEPLSRRFPELYSFAVDKDISLIKLQTQEEISLLFHRPLSYQAYTQFNMVQEMINSRVATEDKDQWLYSWTSPQYSSRKMYKLLMGSSSAHIIFKNLWSTACRLRHKIFYWLLLQDRLNTRNLLHRKSMFLQDYNCAICSEGTEETLVHLFWNCPFSLLCWDHLTPNKHRGISAYDEILLAVRHLPKGIALDIVVMGCWSIWSVRNDKIFRSAAPHLNTWKHYLKEGLWTVQLRAKQRKAEQLISWIEQNL